MRINTIKLNKMLDKAKKIQDKGIYPVHIIDSIGYCAACCGECKYYDLPTEGIPEGMVFIIDDLEDDIEPSFEHVDNRTLEAIVEGNYIMKEVSDVKK